MESLPSMWRVELWHPLIVHFPIVLLLVGTGFRLIGMFLPSIRFLVPAGRWLLGGGALTAWVAIFTGTEAYYAVVRTLCDPTAADAHANVAYWTANLFTAAVILDGVLWLRILPRKLKPFLVVALSFCLLGGSLFLGYTAHLGAKLVYQQGAGVYQPSPRCTEFM